ncbi:DUF3055 domain-containing protein [Gracilibacillus caseinilyticus]|uniref:DUF3055 domain-containing protein n=1 Tax=Gracilibacillus caseinilyticus TaxID=2932256 RepID=A0ABY4EUS0_9BACI|nr:SAV0927 family protein [Gracilibacillus caseinilyticus]UOQ48160.1 DUF3055 domain-containing protein [Gracilibacillus caseinilyticus]
MQNDRLTFIKNEQENSNIRLVSFKGGLDRFDLAIISSDCLGDEFIIVDLNTNKYSKLNASMLDSTEFVEHAFQYSQLEADDFRAYLKPILQEN